MTTDLAPMLRAIAGQATAVRAAAIRLEQPCRCPRPRWWSRAATRHTDRCLRNTRAVEATNAYADALQLHADVGGLDSEVIGLVDFRHADAMAAVAAL